MDIKWIWADFGSLDCRMLYDMLALRAEVFVVEQKIVYQDLDYKDFRARHLLGYHGDTLAAYCRAFAPGDYFDDCAIGRVAVRTTHRGGGLGHELMSEVLARMQQEWKEQPVTISAQAYLEKFYEGHGFETISQPYMEENIIHVRMRRA